MNGVPYSPITERPKLTLPGGANVAVWVIVNVEEWSPFETMPRTVLAPPAGGVPTQTCRTGPAMSRATASASGAWLKRSIT